MITTTSLSRAGDRAHQRPLRAIAIAAAAEHRDQPAARAAAAPSRAGSAARRRCARSRRPRVTSSPAPRRPGSGRARRRAPRCRVSIASSGTSSADRRRRRPRGCCRRSAGRRAASARAARRAACATSKRQPVERERQRPGRDVGRLRRSRRSPAGRRPSTSAGAARIVEVDHAGASARQHLEQPPLGARSTPPCRRGSRGDRASGS